MLGSSIQCVNSLFQAFFSIIDNWDIPYSRAIWPSVPNANVTEFLTKFLTKLWVTKWVTEHDSQKCPPAALIKKKTWAACVLHPAQSMEDLEDQKRKKKKEKMTLGSLSRVFTRGKQRKSLDPGLFDGTAAPDYYIEEDADWWWRVCVCARACVYVHKVSSP